MEGYSNNGTKKVTDKYGRLYSPSELRRARNKKIKRILAFSTLGFTFGLSLGLSIIHISYEILKSEGYGPKGIIQYSKAYY